MTLAARTRRRCLGLALAAIVSGSCAASRGGGAVVGPAATPAAHEWHKDTLLNQEGFWALTLAFEPDYDGPVSATILVRCWRVSSGVRASTATRSITRLYASTSARLSR